MKPVAMLSDTANLMNSRARRAPNRASQLHRGSSKSNTRRVLHLRSAGFSLIELIITIIIVGILAAIAIPSYTAFISGQRIRTASFDLMSTLVLARSEAIKRNTDVTVSSTTGGTDWEGGWSVSVGGATLSVHGPMPGISIAGSAANVVYAGNGRAAAANFAISSTSSSALRCVRINLGGRPSSRAEGCS